MKLPQTESDHKIARSLDLHEPIFTFSRLQTSFHV